jgi:hypothetical protein
MILRILALLLLMYGAAQAQSASTQYYIPNQANPGVTQPVTPSTPLPVTGTVITAPAPVTPLVVPNATSVVGGQATTLLTAGQCSTGCSLLDETGGGFWVNDTGSAATGAAPDEWVPPGSQWHPALATTTQTVSVWPVVTGPIAGRHP